MKTAIVTGAGSGIGKSIAKKLAEDSFVVAVSDINLDKAKKVAEEIRNSGRDAFAVYVDIREEESVKQMVDSIMNEVGSLSLLVNNAGTSFNYSVEDCPIDQFDSCIAINLRGHYLCSHYSLPYLKVNNSSSIINIASTHAFRTQPRFFPYNVAKAGILAMTNSMAIDFGRFGVRVNAICPGLIKSHIKDISLYDKTDTKLQSVLGYHPIGRVGIPDDVAHAVVFLASENASFINGEYFVIDGGRNALTYPLKTINFDSAE
jgi:NAD(P)-dependent dehydrogenase (short-subunit alcohol dehydrogenase family)